jgi:MFS family permease
MTDLTQKKKKKKKKKVQPQHHQPTPLPWVPVLVVGCILMSEAWSGSSLYPFVPFMVGGFLGEENQHRVGFNVGVLASSFSFAQFLSSFLFGRLSDRFGRRMILLWGLVGNIVAIIAFGMSTSLAMAITTRSLSGAINGNLGVGKAMLSDLTDDSNIAKAWVVIGVLWAAGAVMGPALSGMLVHPAKTFPSVFSEQGLFGRHPYLLPCILNALISLFGLVLGVLFLKQGGGTGQPRMRKFRGGKFERLGEDEGKISGDGAGRPGDPELEAGEMFCLDEGEDDDDNDGSSSKIKEMNAMGLDLGDPVTSSSSSEEGPPKERPRTPPPRRPSSAASSVGEGSEGSLPAVRTYTLSFLLGDRRVMATCLTYATMGAVHTFWDEGFSLFASTGCDKQGLGLVSKTIGTILAIGGVVQLAVQTMIFSRSVDRFGYVTLLKTSLVVMVAIYPVAPLTAALCSAPSAHWLMVGLVQIFVVIRNIVGVLAFNSVNILINNAAPPGGVGSVNGLSQSIVALTRAMAPFFGGAVFSWSINRSDRPWPFNISLSFVIMGLLAMIARYLAIPLNANHNKKRTTDEHE